MAECRAYWVTAPGESTIRDEGLRPPGANEVLVRTLYSGISRGTESLVFAGRVPPSEFSRMRAPFQEGEFPAPVKYGYCSVGEIEEGPPELVGHRAFVLYPHQTRYVVPANALNLLPADVPAARAVLAANLETAVNGVWDAAIRPGDRVAVVGGGTVGCLAAWLARQIVGCDVHLVDINPARASIAARLGVPLSSPTDAPTEHDIVIHASGTSSGLASALAFAGFEATVIELSWYGDAAVAVPLGDVFHSKRLTLRSSQVGHVATAQRARWDHRRRMAFVLSLLRDPVLDAMITGESAFDDLPQLMPRLASGETDALCHRIVYPAP